MARLGGVLARRSAADRLAVESSNARTEHQRSEQLWAPVSMNFGPQNCGAVPRTPAAGTSAVIAVEAIGPTPGIVINRRAVGSDFER